MGDINSSFRALNLATQSELLAMTSLFIYLLTNKLTPQSHSKLQKLIILP